MEAEMVRDGVLAASGLLSPKIGGPSVFPPQPEGIWDIPYSDEKWIGESTGRIATGAGSTLSFAASPRIPSFMTFDATSREFCTVRRVRTNTPLQALTTLNDEAFFEAARALAGRSCERRSRGATRRRAIYAFRSAVSPHAGCGRSRARREVVQRPALLGSDK